MFEAIIRRGILVTVVVMIIAVLGILAALRIPVQMIPDLEVRTISIQTFWPGATPQDVEKDILIEQEEFLRNIPYLTEMQSTADFGSAQIELEFPFGVDLTETMIRVSNALTQVPGYPENVDEPRLFATSFSANPFMFFRIAPLEGNPRELNMDMMRDFIEDNVRPRMSSVPGVSQIDIRGGAERQIQILLHPERLAAFDVSVNDVRQAIRQRNRDVSGGEVDSGKRRYLLRTVGRFSDIDEIRELIVARRGDGLTLLGDLADVQLSHFRLREKNFVDTRPVVVATVRRESGSNVIDIMQAMMAEVERINEDILNPEGMEMMLTSDDVRYVEESIFNVWKNLLLGALLATGVMFLFLRSWRSTLLGVVGIPICTIAAFLGLLLAGRTVNVISLAGIAFAIGMTLDNSIVVLESIELERRRGLERMKAALAGVQSVWPAVFASTMTTVMVFLPVVFIAEEAGQLYSDIAIAISSAILVSMLVAITVIPTASARLRFAEAAQQPTVPRWQHGLCQLLEAMLSTAYRRGMTIFLTVAISLGLALWLMPAAEYLPEGEEAKTFAVMNAPPGYNLATMEAIGHEIEAHFMPYVGDDPGRFERGETAVPAMKYINMSISPQRIQVITESVNPAHIEALMDALSQHYESYPGMRAFAARGSIISSNDGGTRSINLDIAGANLADLFAVAQLAYERAEAIFDAPRIQSNPGALSLAQPLLQVKPRWHRLAELGLSAEDLGYAVAAMTDGAFVDEFFLGDSKVDTYLFSQYGTEPSIEALMEIAIPLPGNSTVPLGELADIEESVDTSVIRRVDGRRTVTLNIIPPRSVALETGVERVRQELVRYMQDNGQVPAGVSLSISGAADQLDATRDALSSNYLVALVIVYLLMVAIFSHWGYPLLIMTTIPLGVAGGIAGLALFNLLGGVPTLWGGQGVTQAFDMITMLGFLILMGTVVNNPILIVHRAISNCRDEGLAPLDAVNEAVASRLRPIAMSTVTTIMGLTPLVFLPGAGSELYRGVGVIVMTGIIGATLVTLTMLPALTVSVLSRSFNRARS